MYVTDGRIHVQGPEIIDTAEILTAAIAVRQETGAVVDPFDQAHFDEDRHDFQVIAGVRMAGTSRREQNKWDLDVYDTEGLALGLPRVEEETQAKLDRGGLTWGERRQLRAKLERLGRIREGLATLATENS